MVEMKEMVFIVEKNKRKFYLTLNFVKGTILVQRENQTLFTFIADSTPTEAYKELELLKGLYEFGETLLNKFSEGTLSFKDLKYKS